MTRPFLRRAAAWLALLLLFSGCGQKTPAPDASASPVPTAAATPDAVSEPIDIAPDTLTVLFVNVGRADAALLLFQGKSVLIDTGEESSLPRLLSALNLMGVAQLDAMFLTHTHSDHIGGMLGVGRTIPVTAAYRAEFSEMKKKGGNKIDERAETLGVPLTILSAGDTIDLGNGFLFEMLAPLTLNEQDDNDNSLVLRLSANGRTLLFTGDMQFAEEATLLRTDVSLACNVLKVGNHGNPDATGNDFGLAASPSVAVISTDRLSDANSANGRVFAALPGASVYVTDEFDVGVLLRITPDGEMTVSDMLRPESSVRALKITGFDREKQIVTIQNSGSASVDLSNFLLFSERGGELFRFPAGASVASGASVTVGAEGGSGDYLWIGEDTVWHRKKDDTAVLYDASGVELSRYAG